jgi:hypothetical protein
VSVCLCVCVSVCSGRITYWPAANDGSGINDIAKAFAHFAALAVEHKPMRHQGTVRRLPLCRHYHTHAQIGTGTEGEGEGESERRTQRLVNTDSWFGYP